MSFARFLAAGHVTVGSDIVQRITPAPYWLWREADFLDLHAVAQTNIVMNPPFFRAKGAEAFIRHAFKLATGKVAAFVDLKFLAGSSRANGLYAEMPPRSRVDDYATSVMPAGGISASREYRRRWHS